MTGVVKTALHLFAPDRGWAEFIDLVKGYLTESPPVTNTWYRVIAGSYRDRANAELMARKLTGMGIRGVFVDVKKD